MNVLFITVDQWRGDCLSCAGHPIVRTPHLDALASQGVRFARHFSQAAPCGPGRASLYTGLYMFNHRVVANGSPLDRRFDNIALAARRAGYLPTLFGYTDQAIDPREAQGPRDPRLQSYEEILPGFASGLHLPSNDLAAWTDWLVSRECQPPLDPFAALASEPERPAEHSLSAFLTGRLIEWIGGQSRPWFAHLSQLRPHPPYAAAGRFASLYPAAEMPVPLAPAEQRARLHDQLLAHPMMAAPTDEGAMQVLKSQYFGMVGEADHQLGEIWRALQAIGQWDDTFIVLTSDHGEQLGDHGLVQKGGFFEESFHIPCLIRDPRSPDGHGRVVEAFTENVDLFPTLAEAMGSAVPAACDGHPLTPFLEGRTPEPWREAAHWEFDWRQGLIAAGETERSISQRRLERRALAVLRSESLAYVQFADGTALGFDLAADPTWRTPVTDPAVLLDGARAMLAWRAQHAERTLSGMLIEKGGVGRWPPMPQGWDRRQPQG